MTLEENIIFPDIDGFKGPVLDQYLADGFYRMQFFMFTAHFTQIDVNVEPLPVFWLRTKVPEIRETATTAAIRNRCKLFNVVYKKAYINYETEVLYRIYRNYVTFNASESCSSYLENNYITNPFDAWMIEVRDGDELIAVGYFDRGKNALAGILNFYHPNYKKFSLGKYLMLLKIDFARKHNIGLYYTGYISTAIDKFDYKIFPEAAAMEVLLPREHVWVSYDSIGKEGLSKYVLDWKRH
jgi:arginine-tRNA-protein transferase